MLIPAMGHKIKIKLKAGLNNELVNKIDGLATITKKIFVIHRKFGNFCFVLFMLFLSQMKLH